MDEEHYRVAQDLDKYDEARLPVADPATPVPTTISEDADRTARSDRVRSKARESIS